MTSNVIITKNIGKPVWNDNWYMTTVSYKPFLYTVLVTCIYKV